MNSHTLQPNGYKVFFYTKWRKCYEKYSKNVRLTNEEVYQLIERALNLKNGKQVEPREDLYVANLFFENSTRTKHSFEVAERKHRLNVIKLRGFNIVSK